MVAQRCYYLFHPMTEHEIRDPLINALMGQLKIESTDKPLLKRLYDNLGIDSIDAIDLKLLEFNGSSSSYSDRK